MARRTNALLLRVVVWTGMFIGVGVGTRTGIAAGPTVAEVLDRVGQHQFHPLNRDQSFTSDRGLDKHGIADLDDLDWKLRYLAIRDLVRLLPGDAEQVVDGLKDDSFHVRQIAAAALGIARQESAIEPLEQVLRNDPSALVRAQSAMSLGQMESTGSLELLKQRQADDPSRDVKHQCELAVDQITKRRGATAQQLAAFREINPDEFETVMVGRPAPDFTLNDTEGHPWNLKASNEGAWVVLIWVFADWCPVCHGEFRELISMRQEFEAANVNLATIECHDTYRGRVMVGQEVDPAYWFSRESFQTSYRQGIWWPHLLDLAGRVGAKYGVDPMCFAVHAEYINRPTTVIIDPRGVVRFAYYGTFWGDRPSIHETLEMVKSEDFDFTHSRRLNVSP